VYGWTHRLSKFRNMITRVTAFIWTKCLLLTRPHDFTDYTGVLIGNWIYWTLTNLTTNKFSAIAKLYTLLLAITCTKSYLFISTSRCLTASLNNVPFCWGRYRLATLSRLAMALNALTFSIVFQLRQPSPVQQIAAGPRQHTIVLVFGPRRDLWPDICSFQTCTCFEMGPPFEERRSLTSTGHSLSTGEWLCWRSLSLTHSNMLLAISFCLCNLGRTQ
jgi:hypothetical protein